jgi:hypothetical protein
LHAHAEVPAKYAEHPAAGLPEWVVHSWSGKARLSDLWASKVQNYMATAVLCCTCGKEVELTCSCMSMAPGKSLSSSHKAAAAG